jgi:hypothetical protein
MEHQNLHEMLTPSLLGRWEEAHLHILGLTNPSRHTQPYTRIPISILRVPTKVGYGILMKPVTVREDFGGLSLLRPQTT